MARAGMADLASHRAVHNLTLVEAERASGIVGVRGRMVMEWSDVCSGYALNQRMLMEMEDVDGSRVVSDFRFTTWESRDGLTFRFNLRHEINNRLAEEVAGRATLDGPGQGGTVRFDKPEGATLALPPGTIFPSEHTALTVAATKAGKTRLSAIVFDGSGVDGLYEAVAFVADPLPPESGEKPPYGALAGLASWPVRLAFFRVGDQTGTPEYEMTVRLFSNGVAGDLVLDYDDFSVRGELEQIEMLGEPDC